MGLFQPSARVKMSGERNSSGRLAPMALAALGVVFGDIGTSPLYAMSACFTGPGIAVTPGARARRAIADFLVLGAGHPAQVRRRGIERRQQGRGRSAGPDGAGDQHRARKSAAQDLRDAGHIGRVAVLCGRRDHAGDFGVERRGRPACGGARGANSGSADHRCGVGGIVLDSTPRHRLGRQGFRSGDVGLVRDIGGDGARVDRAGTAQCCRRSIRRADCACWGSTRSARSRCLPASSYASPAARHCMPTWVISAKRRSALAGSRSSCRRWS